MIEQMKNSVGKLVLIASCSALLLGCGTSADVISGTPVEKQQESVSKTEKKSIFKKLQENSHLEVEALITLYYNLKREQPNAYNFENEQELNRLGYDFLGKGKTKSAIEIFKLLVSEFPNAANPYDSLGEAYLKDGNEGLALINYEKSIELNPKNYHAIDQVTILKDLELLDTDWGKEFFHFPLHFAEGIPYEGVEEVVFPKNWIKPDSADFWSYVFVWALENKKQITAEELETNLALYFDGLMSVSSRVDTTKLIDSTIDFERNEDPEDRVDFTGKLNIFDGFATQEPITLNARIYSDYCTEKEQLIVLFRFSPLAFDHEIWEKLRTVKVRSTVCEK